MPPQPLPPPPPVVASDPVPPVPSVVVGDAGDEAASVAASVITDATGTVVSQQQEPELEPEPEQVQHVPAHKSQQARQQTKEQQPSSSTTTSEGAKPVEYPPGAWWMAELDEEGWFDDDSTDDDDDEKGDRSGVASVIDIDVGGDKDGDGDGEDGVEFDDNDDDDDEEVQDQSVVNNGGASNGGISSVLADIVPGLLPPVREDEGARAGEERGGAEDGASAASAASTVLESGGRDPYRDDDSIDENKDRDVSSHTFGNSFEEEDKWEERIWAAARAHWSGLPSVLRGDGASVAAVYDEGDDKEELWLDSDSDSNSEVEKDSRDCYQNDSATSFIASADASTLAATAYRNDEVRIMRKVDEFRSLMVDCLEAYVAVFHAQPRVVKEKKAGRPADQTDAHAKEVVETDEREAGGQLREENGTQVEGCLMGRNVPFDVSVNPYVPLSVTESLVRAVVRRKLASGFQPKDDADAGCDGSNLSLHFQRFTAADEKKSREVEDASVTSPSSSVEVTNKCRRKVKKLMRALLCPELGAFRRYTVGKIVTGNVTLEADLSSDDAARLLEQQRLGEEIPVASLGDDAYSRATTRQRRRRGVNLESESRRDIENILYGSMYEQHKTDCGEKSDDSTKKGKGKTSGEEELRLRSGATKYFLLNQKRNNETDGVRDTSSEKKNSHWEDIFAKVVLRQDILGLGGNSDCERSVFGRDCAQEMNQSRLLFSSAPKDLDVPLCEAYAVRYLPLFLLRAYLSENRFLQSEGVAALRHGTVCLLRQCFLTPQLIQARIKILGPYYSTMFHLADWDSFVSLCRWNLNGVSQAGGNELVELSFSRSDNEDELHRVVSSALVGSMNGILEGVDDKIVASIIGTNSGDSSRRRGFRGESDNVSIDDGKKHTRRPFDAAATSFCLEVGRSLHHLGVRLGRMQQGLEAAGRTDKADEESEALSLTFGSFSANDSVTIEVADYQNSIKAFRSALEMLKSGEASLRKSKFVRGTSSQMNQNPSERTKLRARWEQNRQQRLFYIREMLVSIELYLADSLTCLGYCHDVKLGDYDGALLAYKESLGLYTKHVGKHHIVVSNALHNLGTIHVELEQWGEALKCYKERVRTIKKNKDKREGSKVDTHTCADEDLANSLRCLGKVYVELKSWKEAEVCFRQGISEFFGKEGACSRSCAFVTDVLSTMGRMFMRQSAHLAAKWHGHNELTFIAQDNADGLQSPLKNPDSTLLVSDRNEVEKKAAECFREAVSNRRCALLAMTTGASADEVTQKSPDVPLSNALLERIQDTSTKKTFFDLFQDLTDLGRLCFRRKSYGEAVAHFEEARRIHDKCTSELFGGNPSMIFVDVDEFPITSLLVLLSNAYVRLLRYDQAIECLERTIDILEKREKLPRYQSEEADEGPTPSLEDPDVERANIYHRLGHIFSDKRDFATATRHFQDCIDLMEQVGERARPTRKGEVRRADSTKVTDKDVGSPLVPNRNRTDDDDGTKQVSEDDSLVKVAINTALSSAYWAMGQLYDNRNKPHEALQCFENGMQYHLAAIDAKRKLRSFQMIESVWLSLFAEPLSVTPWGGMSSVLAVTLLSDVHERRAQIKLEEKNAETGCFVVEGEMDSIPKAVSKALPEGCLHLNHRRVSKVAKLEDEDGYEVSVVARNGNECTTRTYKCSQEVLAESSESFERSFKVRSTLSESHSISSLCDEEYDVSAINEDQFDASLLSCCENLLGLLPVRAEEKSDKKVVERWAGWTKPNIQNAAGGKRVYLMQEDVLVQMANIYAKRSEYGRAIEYYKKADEAAPSKGSIVVSEIKLRLGNVYKQMFVGGRDLDMQDNAIQCLEEAIKMLQPISASSEMSLADACTSLAEVCMFATPSDEATTKSEYLLRAVEHLERAISIQRKRRGNLDLKVASMLHLLGTIHMERGAQHIGSALDAFRAAYDARKALLPPNHLDLAETIELLGKAHIARCKDDDLSLALPALYEALRIQNHVRENLPDANQRAELTWKIAQSLSAVGECKFLQKDYEAAKMTFEESLAEFESLTAEPGTDTTTSQGVTVQSSVAEILGRIACIHSRCERTDEALAYYKSALDRLGVQCTRSYSDSDGACSLRLASSTSVQVANFKLEIASLCDKKEKYETSMELYNWCSGIFRDFEGDVSTSLALVLRRRGQLCLRMHDYEGAVSSLKEALGLYRGIVDQKNQDSGGQKARDLNLGILHFELGQGLSHLEGNDKKALEQYRAAVSLLDEMALHPWGAESDNEQTTETQQSLNRKVLQCYHEMKRLTPGTMEGGKDEEEEEMFDILHRIANLHAAYGEYQEARQLYLAVVARQREAHGDNSLAVADLLFNLGTVYFYLGDMENSFYCHEECQIISEAIVGKDSPQLAENMQCLGNISTIQEDFDDALLWYSSAERILRQQEHLSEREEGVIATLVYKKGKVLEKLGHTDNAMLCFKNGLELCKKMGDLESIEVSDMMNSLGNSYKVAGEANKAMKLYKQSLYLRKQRGDELSVANTMNNIGAVFHAQGDRHRAMKFFSQALRTKTLQLGSDHADTARSLTNVGQVYLEEQNFNKARRCFMEALRVLRSKLGVDSVEVAVCLYNLGVALEEGADLNNALKVYTEAIEIFGRTSTEHITFGFALHNAGVIYSKRGRLKDSVRFLHGALDAKNACFGPEHDDTADTRFCLAGVLQELGELDEALDHYTDVLRAKVRRHGKDHVDASNVLVGLGQIHRKKGEFKEAVSCMVEALRVKKIVVGGRDEDVAELDIIIGVMCRDLGDVDAALQYFTDALEIRVFNYGRDHEDVSSCLSLLGGCLFEKGMFDEGLARYQEALEIRLIACVTEDFEVGCLLEKIGTAHQQLDKHEDAIVALEKALVLKEQEEMNSELEDDIGNLYHLLGRSNHALKHYREALRCYNAAVKFRKASSDPEAIGRALFDKADVYEKMEELSTAVLVYKDILEAGCFPPDSWEFGQTLQRLGQSYLAEGLETDALEVTEEAIAAFEQYIEVVFDYNIDREKQEDVARAYECFFELSMRIVGTIGPDGGDMCFRLGDAYVQMGHREKALHWFTFGIKKQQQNLGPDHPSVATGYYNKGNCLLDLGKINDAISCLEESLNLSMEALGEDNEIVADTYYSLAVANQMNSDYRHALELYEKSRKIWVNLLGHTNPNIRLTVAKMAECLQVIGDYDASMTRCREALNLLSMNPGDTATVWARAGIFDMIAKNNKSKGEPEQALHSLHEALTIRRKMQDEDDENQIMIAKELFEMALIHASRGENDKAETLNNRAIDICDEYIKKSSDNESITSTTSTHTEPDLCSRLDMCRKDAGAKLIFLSDTILFYGKLLHRKGDIQDAMTCFAFSLGIYSEKLEPKHLFLGDVLHCRGMGFALKKEYKNAIKCFLEALQVRKTRLIENHPDIEDTLQFLGTVQSELGNGEKAIEYFSDAMSKRESRVRKLGRRDDEADTLLRLGKLHQEKGDYEAARNAYERARYIRLQTKGREHKDLGEVLFALGSLFLDMGRREMALLRFEDALQCYEHSEDRNGSEIGDVLFSMGILHYEQEQLPKAINSYERCLVIRREEAGDNPDASCAQALTNLGCVYYELKEYEKSQCYHVEALDMMEKCLGKEHEDVAYCWHSLGCAYLDDDKENDALSCFSNALRIERKCLDKDHIDIGNSLHMLGRCLSTLNEKEKAISSLTEALRIRKLHLGFDDEDVAATHHHLATIQAERLEENKALDNFMEAIRIRMILMGDATNVKESDYSTLMDCFDGSKKLLRRKFGSDSEQLASLLHRRGICQGIYGKFLTAIDSYAESLAIYKKIYGDRHLTIGNLLFNMGACFNESGDPEKAIKCLAKAHDLTCEKLEDDHSDIADIDYQMGTAYKLLEDFSASVKSYERSLSRTKQVAGTECARIASIMQDIGDICVAQAERCHKDPTSSSRNNNERVERYYRECLEKAERCYKECLRIRKNLEGADSVNVSITLAKLGVLHRTKREYTQALRCFEDSLAVHIQEFKSEDDETAKIYFDLGSIHDFLSSDDKAIFCYGESVRIFSAIESETNLFVAKALSNKASIMLSRGDDDEAAMKTYLRALQIRDSCLGNENGSTAEDLADIIWGQAQLFDRMGENDKALAYYEKCLACYQQSLGHETEQVARCIQSIAVYFFREGHYSQAHDAVVEALRLRETIFGVPEEDIADSMLTLGSILFTWRDYENALPYLDRACRTHTEIRGKYDLSVGQSSFLLGCIYESLQDYHKAMPKLKDSLLAKQLALGEDHQDVGQVLTMIGRVHNITNEPESAVLCFEEALRIATLAHGPDSEEAAYARLSLGIALISDNETDKARECIDNAFNTFKRKTVGNHAGVAKCSSARAMIYEKEDNLEAAREWYTNAAKIFDSLLPETTPKEEIHEFNLHDSYLELASTLFKWGTVEDRLGDERDAMDLYRRAAHLYRWLQGEDNLNVAKVHYNMALMLGRHGNFDEAMDLLQDTLRIRVDRLGKDHPDVAAVLFAIGVAHDKKQEYGKALETYQECMRIQKLEYGDESVEVATTLENYGIAKGNSNDLRGAVTSWEEGLEIMMSLGYDENNPLIINLAGHREIALLLLSADATEANAEGASESESICPVSAAELKKSH